MWLLQQQSQPSKCGPDSCIWYSQWSNTTIQQEATADKWGKRSVFCVWKPTLCMTRILCVMESSYQLSNRRCHEGGRKRYHTRMPHRISFIHWIMFAGVNSAKLSVQPQPVSGSCLRFWWCESMNKKVSRSSTIPKMLEKRVAWEPLAFLVAPCETTSRLDFKEVYSTSLWWEFEDPRCPAHPRTLQQHPSSVLGRGPRIEMHTKYCLFLSLANAQHTPRLLFSDPPAMFLQLPFPLVDPPAHSILITTSFSPTAFLSPYSIISGAHCLFPMIPPPSDRLTPHWELFQVDILLRTCSV